MSAKTKLSSMYDFDRMKKDIGDLKVLLTDQFSSQAKINGELRAEMESMKLRVGQLGRLNRVMKVLMNKYKEQKIEMNLLIKLLRGKLENVECECGRMVKSLSVVQVEQKKEKEKKKTDNQKVECGRMVKSLSVVQVEQKKKKKKEKKKSDSQISDASQRSENGKQKQERKNQLISNKDNVDSKFTYTQEQRAKIGQKILQGWEPLECLNDSGGLRFSTNNNNDHAWKEIVNKREGRVYGRPILLPRELSGMALYCRLDGLVFNNSRDEFEIAFKPFYIEENEKIALPVEFSVVFQLKLSNGEYRTSDKQKFVVNDVFRFAQPFDFRMSFKDTDKEIMPEFILKFYLN